ncbi:MAG: His-Xaa-Ser system protein HxsD [Candidatus Omnitrophota bacterium]
MKIVLNQKIYPTEVILNACYMFLENCFIFLEQGKKDEAIVVYFKTKKKKSAKFLKSLKDAFTNELLHCSLRYQISRNNKKLREYIVGRALYTPFSNSDLDILEDDKELDYVDDPLGIAIPWEDKFGKKKKNEKASV